VQVSDDRDKECQDSHGESDGTGSDGSFTGNLITLDLTKLGRDRNNLVVLGNNGVLVGNKDRFRQTPDESWTMGPNATSNRSHIQMRNSGALNLSPPR
jgi:hypothetical protein